MGKIEYKKAVLDEPTVASLIELSKAWAEEGCTFGLRANTKEDLREPCYVALDEEKIVGYAFGHYYVRETPVADIPIGEECFELDELFVLPAYRDSGIGKSLFSLIEKEAKKRVRYLTLGTATKDYSRILRFYLESNEMTFHSAFLFKEIS